MKITNRKQSTRKNIDLISVARGLFPGGVAPQTKGSLSSTEAKSLSARSSTPSSSDSDSGFGTDPGGGHIPPPPSPPSPK